MKFSHFLLVVFAGCVLAFSDNGGLDQTGKLRDFISDQINKSVNDLVANITDPMPLDDVIISSNNGSLIGSANITGLTISGLKGMVATSIEANLFTKIFNMILEIPTSVIDMDYWADLLVAELLPFYGSGHNIITIRGTQIKITGIISLSDGVSLNNVTREPILGSPEFALNGLLNNAEFTEVVNSILNDVASSFLSGNTMLLSNIMDKILGEGFYKL